MTPREALSHAFAVLAEQPVDGGSADLVTAGQQDPVYLEVTVWRSCSTHRTVRKATFPLAELAALSPAVGWRNVIRAKIETVAMGLTS